MPDKTVIFLHMPKAGGTTLNTIIDWNYEHVHFIAQYDQLPPLLALPDEKKRQIDCLKGHVYYGIHRVFPQDCTYITLLRHPVDRVVSQYYYNFERKRRLGEPIPDWSIEEFLDVAPFHASYQLRLLVGGDNIDAILNDPLPENAVEIAQENLTRDFVVAGVMDYYDETLLLMKHALGWPRAFYARKNINPNREPTHRIAADTRRMLEDRCAAEIELYDTLKQQTEALLARQDAAFQRELVRLRRMNRVFGRVWNLTRPIHQTPIWEFSKRTLRGIMQRG
jgi:hypothetical protein